MIKRPAAAPCRSCPYRRDVPSGVWAAKEYEQLPAFDRPIHEQPPVVFMCHQQDGRLCAGWAGCHDMRASLGLRILGRQMGRGEHEATLDYVCEVPLWGSGAEAAEHGMREIDDPGQDACRAANRLGRDPRRSFG